MPSIINGNNWVKRYLNEVGRKPKVFPIKFLLKLKGI